MLAGELEKCVMVFRKENDRATYICMEIGRRDRIDSDRSIHFDHGNIVFAHVDCGHG